MGGSKNGNIIHPPIVSHLIATRRFGSHQTVRDCRSPLVRSPGSDGDTGFHRGSRSEDEKINMKPGMEAPEAEYHRRRVMLYDPRITRVL